MSRKTKPRQESTFAPFHSPLQELGPSRSRFSVSPLFKRKLTLVPSKHLLARTVSPKDSPMQCIIYGYLEKALSSRSESREKMAQLLIQSVEFNQPALRMAKLFKEHLGNDPLSSSEALRDLWNTGDQYLGQLVTAYSQQYSRDFSRLARDLKMKLIYLDTTYDEGDLNQVVIFLDQSDSLALAYDELFFGREQAVSLLGESHFAVREVLKEERKTVRKVTMLNIQSSIVQQPHDSVKIQQLPQVATIIQTQHVEEQGERPKKKKQKQKIPEGSFSGFSFNRQELSEIQVQVSVESVQRGTGQHCQSIDQEQQFRAETKEQGVLFMPEVTDRASGQKIIYKDRAVEFKYSNQDSEVQCRPDTKDAAAQSLFTLKDQATSTELETTDSAVQHLFSLTQTGVMALPQIKDFSDLFAPRVVNFQSQFRFILDNHLAVQAAPALLHQGSGEQLVSVDKALQSVPSLKEQQTMHLPQTLQKSCLCRPQTNQRADIVKPSLVHFEMLASPLQVDQGSQPSYSPVFSCREIQAAVKTVQTSSQGIFISADQHSQYQCLLADAQSQYQSSSSAAQIQVSVTAAQTCTQTSPNMSHQSSQWVSDCKQAFTATAPACPSSQNSMQTVFKQLKSTAVNSSKVIFCQSGIQASILKSLAEQFTQSVLNTCDKSVGLSMQQSDQSVQALAQLRSTSTQASQSIQKQTILKQVLIVKVKCDCCSQLFQPIQLSQTTCKRCQANSKCKHCQNDVLYVQEVIVPKPVSIPAPVPIPIHPQLLRQSQILIQDRTSLLSDRSQLYSPKRELTPSRRPMMAPTPSQVLQYNQRRGYQRQSANQWALGYNNGQPQHLGGEQYNFPRQTRYYKNNFGKSPFRGQREQQRQVGKEWYYTFSDEDQSP